MSAAQVYAAGSSLQPVTGLPYSAEEEVQKAMLYRDSKGRTRTETNITP